MVMKKRKNKVIVILGPTSSGKSKVAIKLAKKFNGEIISADSRQVYRGMDIGTGKVEPDRPGEIPVKSARGGFSSGTPPFISAGIPHYMIDIVSPKTDYNVAKFKKQADRIIADILSRGKLPIICGGTGFWIKAIVDNVKFPEVKPDWKLRKKLNKKKITGLIQELKKLDPDRLKAIDKNNKVRLIRAIEICKTLGRVPTNNLQSTTYNFLQFGIKLPEEKLYQNIKKRLEARFKQGMIKEVKDLREKYKLSWKKIQSFGLGYYWIPLYLQGELTKLEVFEKIYPMEYPAKRDNFAKRNLFHRVYQSEKDYAKRQMTWFKKDKRIKWLRKYKDIEKEVKNFIK